MATVTLTSRGDVCRMFAGGNRAIVATGADPDDLRVIHRSA